MGAGLIAVNSHQVDLSVQQTVVTLTFKQYYFAFYWPLLRLLMVGGFFNQDYEIPFIADKTERKCNIDYF